MTERMMAVFHLSTGHVVGAMTAGRQVPTVAQATGGEHIVVRIPGGKVVRVPAELITGLTAPVNLSNDDVLTRPTDFGVTDSKLLSKGKPVQFAPALANAGQEALSIWDGLAAPEVVPVSLDATGALPQGTRPPGAHGLVAIEGKPLMFQP